LNIAVIPARGGSKRIPKKNIKLFCNKPIMAYSIGVAITSKLFDRVIVSTDNKEIADTAKEYGAEVPFMRPSKLADDYTGTDEVFLHALNFLMNAQIKYKNACCIYPTAPFLTVSLISDGLDKLIENNATSCFPVLEFSSPIFRALEINEKGRLDMISPKYKSFRSQDLQNTYRDSGQFYWVNIKKYFVEKSILSNDSIPIILSKYDAIDIDTDEDWRFAESMYKTRNLYS